MFYKIRNPILKINNLKVYYSNNPILLNINLSLPKGFLIGIIGPNGAGKSTLIKSIMGLLNNYIGNIKLFKNNLNKVRNLISYIPQKDSVDWDFPASVLDVVLMGRYSKLNLFEKPNNFDKIFSMNCLKKVGMEKYYNKQISQLSEGQKQRLFIARALAQEANLYFLDEPFSGVDISTERETIGLFKSMSNEGKTIVIIHHDLQSIISYFNWLLLLNIKLIASGPTQGIFKYNLFQKAYLGKLVILNSRNNFFTKESFLFS